MTLYFGEALIAFLYIFLPGMLGFLHAFGKKDRKAKIQLLLSYYLFIAVGIQGLVTGYVQIAQPALVVDYVQWPYSPFLLELGMANVAFGFLGILSLKMDQGWRAATATGYGLFLFLTGVGHLLDIFHQGPTPGSAGFFLVSDLLVPVSLFILASVSSSRQI